MYVAALINVGAGMLTAVLPLFVFRDLGLTPQTYGLAISVGAVGGIAGSLVGMPVRGRLGELRSMRTAQVVLPIGVALMPATLLCPAVLAPVLIGASEFVIGLAIVVHTICSVGIRARVTPPALMGRVSAASRFVTLGAVPIGSLLGGLVGSVFGHPAALVLVLVFMAAAPVVSKLSPIGRLREVPPEWEAGHGNPGLAAGIDVG